MRNEHDANNALASRTHRASAIKAAAAREARRNRRPLTIDRLPLGALFALAAVAYAGYCLFGGAL